MNDHNSNYQNDSFGNDYRANQSGGTSYEYVFSNGMGGSSFGAPPQKPKKKSGAKTAVTVVLVAICMILCFSSGAFGAALYLRLADQTPSDIVAAPDPDSVHVENPGSILDKEDSEPSLFGSAGDEVFSVSQVAHSVLDSVVVVEASVITSSMFGQTSTGTSTGSGVVIHQDGYILTCNHVVEKASSVTVTLNSGTRYAATLVGTDSSSDLAVLKIDPKETLIAAKQGCSADLVLGEQVVAIGNPLGTLYRTVTTGVVSGLEREILTSDGTTMTLLQTDAAVNSGNSGGGLFNLDGELIGIVNAKYAEEGVEGLAFAIPIDWAYEVQLDLIEFGYVRGIVDHGLNTIDVDASNINKYHYYYGIDTVGVYVVESKYNSELKNKDRIVSVNGVEVSTTAQMDAIIDACKVGDTVTIIAERDGKTFTTTITLQEYVPENVSEKLQ